MAIEIVDFPIKNGGSFHSYVKLPEGTRNIPEISMAGNLFLQETKQLLGGNSGKGHCCFGVTLFCHPFITKTWQPESPGDLKWNYRQTFT